MSRPLLTLVMMVKDEGKNLRAVLNTVKDSIDRAVIVDTGSTDDTCEIARDALGDKCAIFHEPWQGYAATRNRVLELAGTETVFTLMLSGDEYVRDGEKLREYLETQRDTDTDAIFLNLALDDGMSRQARVLRTGSAWRYDDFDLGIHEVPVHPDPKAKVALSTGGYIEHIASNPIDRMNNIWENHIPMLRQALERNPKNGRALEFLIQSLEAFIPHPNADDPDEPKRLATECVELYTRRFELPFSTEGQRRYFVMRFIDTARIAEFYPPEILLGMANELCKADGNRPEAFFLRAAIGATVPGKKTHEIYELAKEAATVAEKVRLGGGLNDSSPLDMSTEWKAHRLAAIAAAHLAKKHPENLPLVRDHIAAGLSVGGPWMMFKGIADDGKIEAKISLEENP